MSSQSPELPPPGATPTTPTLPPETNATSLPPTVTPPEATLPPPTEVTSPPPFPDTNVTSSTTPPAPTATNETTPATSNVPTSTNGSGVSSGLPSGGGLPTGALVGLIVGLVLGAVIVLIAVGIFVICYRGQKRKKAEALAGHAPPPPPLGPKDDPQHLRQNAAQFNMLPKPSPPPGFASNPSQLAVNVYPSMEPPSSNSSLGSEKPPARSPSPGMILGFYQSTYSYEELARATDNFSNMNLIGQGGFGYVHKGVLPNGKVVAIKQLKAGSGQGEREFQAEVEIISRVHHRHLVSLVGCCIAGSQRMLVYEFVPNNTLEFHLHGKGRPVMKWPTRMKIALGSARGLAYLHEDCQPKIIHRDIKASNILLDDSFEAKVADFGLAKSSLDTDTHVSTRVMGTFGYLAPEYASSGKLTEKSDVFSFGVVLLELITGRRPVDRNRPFVDDSIVDWAKPLLTDALENGNFEALVDPRLEGDYDPSEMTRLAACAAACVRHSAKRRPKMSQIVRALEGNMSLDDLSYGVTPGHSSVFSSYGSSDYSSVQHKEDLEKFRKMVLESQVQSSSEYSGLTSEYGQNPSSSSTEGRQTTQEMESQRLEKDKEDFSKSS